MPCAACLRRREAIRTAAGKVATVVTRAIPFPKRVDVRPPKRPS